MTYLERFGVANGTFLRTSKNDGFMRWRTVSGWRPRLGVVRCSRDFPLQRFITDWIWTRSRHEIGTFPARSEASILLFSADSIRNHRKGFKLLLEALAGLKDVENLFLLSVGRGEVIVPDSIPHLHMGYVSDDRFLSLIYSAADVFVIPSLQEAFGQTALEATACGTPVIGFAVGGIPEVVRHGVTGLLVPPRDVASLRAAIVDLLRDPVKRAEMSASCRHIALDEYNLELQASRYTHLYQKIVARRNQEAPSDRF
jgi:glycosyltransferase involved in cell wall biosynthesis